MIFEEKRSVKKFGLLIFKSGRYLKINNKSFFQGQISSHIWGKFDRGGPVRSSTSPHAKLSNLQGVKVYLNILS